MLVGYANACRLHVSSVVPSFVIQGGDFVNGDGTGTFSIYGGQKFAVSEERNLKDLDSGTDLGFVDRKGRELSSETQPTRFTEHGKQRERYQRMSSTSPDMS